VIRHTHRAVSTVRRRTHLATRTIALAAILCCLNLSCGIQGQPLPPRIQSPQQIADLSVIQQGRALVLRFTLPELATDGERLTKPLEIQIFRTVTPPGAPAKAPEALAAPSAVLGPEEIRRLTVSGKITYSSMLTPQDYSNTLGDTYAFAVRGLTRGFRNRPLEGALSKVVSVELLDVSAAPENLRAHATEKAVEISWNAVEKSLAGRNLADLSGYRVFRSGSGKPGTFAMLAETSSPSYRDSDFEFDYSYSYKVRAVFKDGTTAAVSDDSQTAEITPHDVFPPAVPQEVTAIYTAGAVEIVWTPSPEPDLAGYNVLRRESGPTEVKVNKELIRTPVFRDRTAQAGKTYFYRVTAVDFAGNESAFSAEARVETH
jgi:hypothetical protein